MGQLICSPSSLEDFEAIAGFIARDSVDRAALFVTRIIESTDRLLEFPLSGRVIPQIGDQSCREIIYESYHILYRIEGDGIWITELSTVRGIGYPIDFGRSRRSFIRPVTNRVLLNPDAAKAFPRMRR
jgi:toxin ParE1/3/4